MKKALIACFFLSITILSLPLVAQEGAAVEAAPRGFWEVLFDNALSITLLFVFISALVGTILKNLSVDKCLRHFDKFHVTLELADGDLVWGALRMYNTGLELLYREARLDSSGHYETSFILYSSEYDHIQSICRYHGDLSPKGRRVRESDIRKTYQPTIFARTIRWLRNLMNTFADAFSKALNLIIGQMKKVSPGSVILKQDAHLTKIGTDIIGYAGNEYDSILERYIGQKVVVEVNYVDRKEEFLGILKEYTSAFMELLNVQYLYNVKIPLKGQGAGHVEISGVYVIRDGDQFRIQNQSAHPVLVYEVVKDGESIPINEEISPADTKTIFNNDPDTTDVVALTQTTRVVDLILPRAKALIRHAGPRENVGWKELLGFDDVQYFFGRFTKK
jgi:hypothetical protein